MAKQKMHRHAKALEFEEAAKIRDQLKNWKRGCYVFHKTFGKLKTEWQIDIELHTS